MNLKFLILIGLYRSTLFIKYSSSKSWFLIVFKLHLLHDVLKPLCACVVTPSCALRGLFKSIWYATHEFEWKDTINFFLLSLIFKVILTKYLTNNNSRLLFLIWIFFPTLGYVHIVAKAVEIISWEIFILSPPTCTGWVP